jgi:hypothetical protein
MRRFGLLVVPLVVLTQHSAAFAHKLELVAKYPIGRPVVRVEVGFEGDEPAEGARVRLLDAAGAVVAEGTSDAHGVCELPRPAPGEYTLVANDGDGHQAKLAVVVPPHTNLEPVEVGRRSSLAGRVISALVGVGLIALAAVALILFLKRRARTPPGES